MFKHSLLFSGFILSISALFTPHIHTRGISYSTPIPPSKDPWYTAPPNFQHAAPGTILRVRVAPGDIPSTVANCSQAYDILFRTTDSRYNASWAVTTLYVPLSSSNSSFASHALLSYQLPYNSADVDASPSYAGAGTGDLSNALGRGWYVNFPDFEGPHAASLTGITEGHAVLDSVRAVLSAGFGLGPDTKYAMWGYSGGSIASTWAAELQQQYAPELDFSGIAVGGIVPNLTTSIPLIDGTQYAGLMPAVFLGLTEEYPEARQYLISRLKTTGPYNATGFLHALDLSFEGEFAFF